MSFRRNLMLFSACTAVAVSPVFRNQAVAQTSPASSNGVPSQSSNQTSETATDVPFDVEVKRQQLLLKQKDVVSAITEVGPKEIEAAGSIGSVQSLLQQSAPNIHVYQQGPGQNFPIISVRGVRGAELAQTLDGIPTQDLIFGGQGAFETSNVGAPFTLEEIDGVTVYPGVSAPGTQGYGTTGGTLAYTSKKPTDESFVDLLGSVGSFGTTEYGFTANSGKIQELDGLKVLLQYTATNTGGYVDNTNAQYRDMLFAFDKPYDGGLSHVTGTVIYNNDFGYIQPQPTATPLLDFYGKYYNSPKSEQFFRQDNDFLTVIVGDQTYISDTFNFSGNLFYIHENSDGTSYENPNLFIQPGAPSYNGGPNTSYYYFSQNISNFYGAGYYGGPGTPRYNARFFNYNPNIYGDSNLGFGNNAQRSIVVTDTEGATPKFQAFLPFNNITLGGLVARSKQSSQTFYGGTPDIPLEPLTNALPGQTDTRTIYQIFLQDKIDLLDDTLHIEPGLTFEGALSQLNVGAGFSHNPLVDANGGYELQKWDRELLPYIGAHYDLPYNLTAFGSYGESALYAPLDDFALGNAGSSTTAPSPAIAHAFEGGLRYNTEDLLVSADYFYQKIDRAFGFFQNPKTQLNINSNVGIEEFKGVEAAVKYKITPEITAFGNAGYTLAKYLTSYPGFTSIGKDQFGYAFKGQPISGVPDWTATIGVDYNKKDQFVEGDEFFARLFTNYTGAQPTSLDLNPNQTDIGSGASVVPGGTLGAATTSNKKLPASQLVPICCGTFGSIRPYWIVNAVIDYTYPVHYAYVKQVKFELNAQNIFNTHFFGYYYNQYAPLEGSYGDSGNAFNDGLVGPPASVQFTTTVRF